MNPDRGELVDREYDLQAWRSRIATSQESGARFAGLFGTSRQEGTTLTAVVVEGPGPAAIDTHLTGGTYPSLTDVVAAAFWYERALHDLSGITPIGHPRLDPLLLHRGIGTTPPRPGAGAGEGVLTTAELKGPTDVSGAGMFTIPYGPVRSGVFESVEYLIETPGEDIPHLNIRPHYKHRGMAKNFEGRTVADALVVAERVEGVSSVAHALAFCHAIEQLAGVEIDEGPGLVRLVHAELERVANHLDVALRLADAAGLAVATARMGWHKERVLRLVSELCGNRFGRGVIAPGGLGVGLGQLPEWHHVSRRVGEIRRELSSDAVALMRTASFLDRLRGTGVLEAHLARRWGALGPVGRASGADDDHRRIRPYDGYLHVAPVARVDSGAGDAQARLAVRWQEVESSFDLLAAALARLGSTPSFAESKPQEGESNSQWRAMKGRAIGVAEAAQGEVLYSVEVRDGRIVRCFARSASLHNLPLYHDVFHGDIFTDFPFIEASFGLSIAGVAM